MLATFEANQSSIPVVAVVGTGVIGRSWVQVFIRAGCQTRIYDENPDQIERALTWLDQDLAAEQAVERRSLVSVHTSLSDALNGAGYVQESGPEQIEVKKAIYRSLDDAAGP